MDSNGSEINMTDLQGMLDCPVCFKMMKPQIFQCENGHTICKECNQKVNKCPTCRCNVIGIRCLFAERISEKMSHSCVYSDNGCIIKLRLKEIVDHEKSCPYRPFQCPFRGKMGKQCAWLESLFQFENHIRSGHYKMWQTTTVIQYVYSESDMEHNKECRTLILAFEKLFWISSINNSNKRLYLLSVQHVGPEDDDDEYRYTVTCTFPNTKNEMKATFEAEVHSFAEDYKDIFKSKFCYILPHELIEIYIRGSQLELEVEIKKVL